MVETLRKQWWGVAIPVVGVVVLALTWNAKDLPLWAVLGVGAALAASVLVAVHHAEVIAHRVGEPYGSLVLAVAVTVIEVGLILTLVLAGGEGTASLARDTVFAAVMITTNGVVGLSLFAGSLKHGIVRFNREGAGALLAAVVTLSVLCFVLPVVTSGGEDQFTRPQLIFAAAISLAVYALVVTTQTLKHRDFFLPVPTGRDSATLKTDDGNDGDEEHAEPPTTAASVLSVVMLLVSLVAVVGLAKVASPSIEAGLASAGIPHTFLGVVIALLVLLPESIAAVRAASRNRLQTSLNLAYGSALASIGLTIPTIAIASLFLAGPVLLGLGGTQIVLLILTAIVSTITIGMGRSTRLQGGVHLAIFAAYIFLSISP
jgi:Ca2+:H+ antiporter